MLRCNTANRDLTCNGVIDISHAVSGHSQNGFSNTLRIRVSCFYTDGLTNLRLRQC